jgi:hypothetical protein
MGILDFCSFRDRENMGINCMSEEKACILLKMVYSSKLDVPFIHLNDLLLSKHHRKQIEAQVYRDQSKVVSHFVCKRNIPKK